MDLLKELELHNKETKINLEGLSLDELNKIVSDANILIRKKQFIAKEERKVTTKTKLKIGDIVVVVDNRFEGEVWEVLKLNPKKVKYKRENG